MPVRKKSPAGDQQNRLLEVIVTSVDDAIAAEKGGAGRLEIIRNFAAGGLTPAIELVKAIQLAVSIPVRVMLRENPGFDITNQSEFEKLCQDAKAFSALGVDGLVLGFLCEGEIDFASMRTILSCAPLAKATFHRAFETLKHPRQAIESLKRLRQVDRILTSGGIANWQQNVDLLNRLQKCAEPEITILVGGGLDVYKVEALCAATKLREFHVGRSVRHPQQIDGLVSADRVRAIRRIIA